MQSEVLQGKQCGKVCEVLLVKETRGGEEESSRGEIYGGGSPSIINKAVSKRDRERRRVRNN